MRAFLALLVVGALGAGCAGRQVDVSDGPAAAQASTSIRVSNGLTQAVNVYVVQGASETFVRQVAANSTTILNVPGVASGSTVSLRARTVDGTRTYSRDDAVLSGVFDWSIP